MHTLLCIIYSKKFHNENHVNMYVQSIITGGFSVMQLRTLRDRRGIQVRRVSDA